MRGWISIHRQIKDNWLWQEKPFSKGQAWIDLLMLANHADKKVLFDSKLIEVKRGSHITSIRKLCEAWGWSNSKVVNFITILKKEQMIDYKSDTKKTVISIVNYGVYQDDDIEKRHRNDTETTQKHTNNNDNNDNKLIINNSDCSGISVAVADLSITKPRSIYSFFESNGFGMMTEYYATAIHHYLEDGLEGELIIRAMQEALNKNKRNWGYVNSILNRCVQSKITTVRQFEAEKASYESEKKPKKQTALEMLEELMEEGKNNDEVRNGNCF